MSSNSTVSDGTTTQSVGFLLLDKFTLISLASAVEPLRMANQLSGRELFYSEIHLHGGPAPVRRFLPKLMELIGVGAIDPGKVFDLTLPLEQVAEGYRAMDERRSIKALLLP